MNISRRSAVEPFHAMDVLAEATRRRAAGRPVTLVEHPGVDHAFNNDTSAARYNREAAEQAWAATLEFLGRHLGTSRNDEPQG